LPIIKIKYLASSPGGEHLLNVYISIPDKVDTKNTDDVNLLEIAVSE
jgi:hypothetical protein